MNSLPALKIVGVGDFDIMTFLDETLPNEAIYQAIATTRQRIAVFRAACFILNLLLEAIETVITLMKNPVFGSIDIVLAIANFIQSISDEDREFIDQAFTDESCAATEKFQSHTLAHI